MYHYEFTKMLNMYENLKTFPKTLKMLQKQMNLS